jgi:hypothetical protein
MTHPVEFTVSPPAEQERVHVAIRLVLLLALGAIGCSSLYWLLYLLLPALAALLIAGHGAARYLADDAPGAVRALRWLASAYAYLWLLSDAPPLAESSPLELEPGGAPTAGSALARLVYSLPALVVLAILSFVAGFAWIIGALAILVRRRQPRAIAAFLALTLRYQFRLIAYHLSLVDRYPSLADTPAAHATPSEAT